MKRKDIITILVAVVLIGASVFVIYRMLAPKSNSKQPVTSQEPVGDTFTGDIDEETLKLISEKKDYGEATLDNIGRTNPFGPLN